MNRFILYHHPTDIAQSLCDQHVVKMPLEEAQMLCTALWHHRPEYAERRGLYKPVHQKHPCTGHDDLKTDEKWPIRAYRQFYKRDKMSFARWNKNRAMPEWLQEGIYKDDLVTKPLPSPDLSEYGLNI